MLGAASAAAFGTLLRSRTCAPPRCGLWLSIFTAVLGFGLGAATRAAPAAASGGRGELLAGPLLADAFPLSESATKSFQVRRAGSARLEHAGAVLDIGDNALSVDTSIGVRPLASLDLRPLDPGLTNATGASRAGYRFLPHMRFAKPIHVRLPYREESIPAGMGPEDLHTYYFDEAAGSWKALERVRVDTRAREVVSLTDHFTDMINATVTVPEHPEGASFNPNQMADIKAADPSSRVNLIAPPDANNQGDNRLSYPIEVSPGRQGLQPELAVRYDSSAGNGWMGVGWDLQTPAITIDTRWGVPRYDARSETETYVLNGEQLTPVAHRGELRPRSSHRVFHTRVEGGFARIERHGDDPSRYTWEVTDKSGTRSFYGLEAGRAGPADDATLADAAGNVFVWALREVRDTHGNFVRYHYARVDDSGIQGGSEPGRNLYVKKITYTGHGSSEGRYSVTFVRDRELGEELRPDIALDARGGFKRVTADLLRRIDVSVGDELIRRYGFDYKRGAFSKTLLRSVHQFDENGRRFNSHELDYFDDIRDDDGQYRAFERKEWNSPGDDLRNDRLNLSSEQAGDASALNANGSSGGGGHLYVGVGSRKKSGSIGVKAGFSRSDDKGILALADVDGDALPDKVFKRDGSVFYRKNLARPGGEARFAAAATALTLPGFMRESSDSLNLGIEGYLGGVAAQLNYVDTFAKTSQYFSDVNGDGIADLVDDTRVLFGRLGSDGIPRYGTSDATPVPITSGSVDATGLVGSLGADRERLASSFPLLDSLRRWTAPYDGVVRVEGGVRLAAATAQERAASTTADGVRVAIQHEAAELWSDRIGARDDGDHHPTGVSEVAVRRGDRLYFRVQSVFDGALDEVSWNPRVTYADADGTVDVNGLAHYRYSASGDFTLGGRTSRMEVPLNGTMHLSGTLAKTAATTDDVKVVITRDGAPVFERSLAADAPGTVPIDLDLQVQKGQQLEWRVRVDSPIDLGTLAWTPRAYYTAAEGVDRVTDPSGRFLIDIHPPYNVDMYPVDGLDAPQQSFHVADDGELTVAPELVLDIDGDTPDATVAFTVKRRDELVAKRFFEVEDGRLTSPPSFAITANAGDELYFDFSTLDPKLRASLRSRSVAVAFGADPAQPAPSAFHSAAEEGAFPQPYRGWSAIGYNGNGTRAEQPIVQGDLVIDADFADQLPDQVDPQSQRDAFASDPRIDPPKVMPYAPSPKHGRWEAGTRSWVSRDAASGSRLGAESVRLPDASDFADASAVPRMSRSEQISLTGSVGGPIGSIGGSIATGDSTGETDFVDMNGDRFPDVLGASGIQYTDMGGTLGSERGALPDGAVRKTHTVSGNASAGSAARTIVTGRGYASPPGHSTANTAKAGNDMPPLGVGGSLGQSSSDGRFDLLDMNGDDLPDRVYEDGRVALNLGYRFGVAEPWRNPAPLNKGSGSTVGLNIGFNTDFYGFAGGASYSQASSSAEATLMDLNGDGLLDRVFAASPIRVALNTGNGFADAVTFNGSLPDLNDDQNATLGGGVYVTIPICFFVCIVINPGADVSIGASRTEQMLRDINGDGYADHLSSSRDDELVVAENRTRRTNLLRSVTRPLGARIDFDYRRDGNTYEQPESRWLLSRVAVHDGRPGDGADVKLVTYDYADGAYSRLERQFFGYGTVTEQERNAGAADAVYRSVVRGYSTSSYYTRGLLRSERTIDGAGRPFKASEHTYSLRHVGGSTPADPDSTGMTIFPQLSRTDERFYEGEPTPGKSTHVAMEYDALGNLTRRFDAADAGSADDIDARIDYTATDPACLAAYIVGVPTEIRVLGNGTLMRRRASTVDCATGDITQVRAHLANGDVATTDMTYLPDGNLRGVLSPPNHKGDRYRLTYTYDPLLDTHVETITDSFGLRSRATYSAKFGLAETTTDFNDQAIRTAYDAVGRVDSITGPYEANAELATIDFEYHPETDVPYAVTRHADRQADGSLREDTIDTVSFVDGLARPIQTKKDATLHAGADTPATLAMTVSGRVVYDFVGRAVEQFYPVSEAKGAANTSLNTTFDDVTPTRSSYDVLDRTTRTVLPDDTTAQAKYGFGQDRSGVTQFETIATDAEGKSKRTYTDVRTLTTAVKEFNAAGGQPEIWTSYRYDPLGQLTAVTDDKANVTTSSYDALGRRTVVDSPDAGRTETVYDLADNDVRKITSKLRADQKAIAYDYDFNRLAAIRYPHFTANNVAYTYGGPGAANNSAGRITAIKDGAGTLTREYGPLGEVTKETRGVRTQGSHTATFTTQYRFDAFNRVLAMTFPDGEQLSYRYDSGGLVDRATGVKGEFTYQYLKRLEYDKFEQRVLLETGNGTQTSFSYGAEDRRLDNLRANLANGYAFQNLNYGYDDVGNVTTIENDTLAPDGPYVGMQVGGPSTQTFAYDDLDRLTHSEGTYQPRTPRTDRYRFDIAYDSIHNVTRKTQVHELVSPGNAIVDGKTSYDYSYAYRGPRPHAPSTIGPYTLGQDPNGNEISRAQQPRRQLIWDEENRLACSHENVQSKTLPQVPASCDNPGGAPEVRFAYDDQGNRIIKDSSQFHVYPNQHYSTRGNQAYKHVYAGETKLVTKFVEPDRRYEDRQYYSHGDHLASTGFVTDVSGQLSEHLKYFPGGETWVSEHPSQPVAHQYTGKEIDPETGLYYFGARYYDPRTQLWQSPDPVLASYLDGSPNGGVYTSGNLGLYSYALNNPVRLRDPDGRFANVAAGAGIGALIGLGIEGARQVVTGEYNGRRLAAAGAAGAVSGAVAGATFGGSLLVQGAASVGGGVAAGVVSRGITGEEQTLGAVGMDGAVSALTFGLVKGGGAVIKSLRGSAAVRGGQAAAKDVPTVVFSRSKGPGIAQNFDDAVANGAPTRLTRVDAATRDANRRAALRGQRPAPAGQSLDEYPFACSAQGGCGSFVRPVAVGEQSYQGGVLSRFFQDRGVQPGDPFDVIFGP